MTSPDTLAPMLRRPQGCLLGQRAGGALGSREEFMEPEEIRGRTPDGVRDLAGAVQNQPPL